MKNGYNWRPSNLESIWREWLAPLKYYEPSLIMTYPGSDVVRRSAQLFDNLKFIENELGISEVEIKVIDYRTHRWSNGQELHDLLNRVTKNIRIVWFFGFEEILREGRSDLIIELQSVYRDNNQRLVLVCEANYYDLSFEQLILTLPSFDPRISLHGNYGEVQLKEFIEYLAKKWDIAVTDDISKQIIGAAGSNLRLIKLLMWHLRDEGIDKLSESFESPQIWWQVRSLWHKLSENEKKVILAHVYGLKKTEVLSMSREYVEKMRLLEIPVLEKFVRKYIGNPLELNVENDRLFIGGKDYSDYFTDKQKIILKTVLTKPDQCISREEVIEATWSKDIENGSDWALDSQVNRLRQRLQEVGIGKKHLSTRRGKGIVWLSQ